MFIWANYHQQYLKRYIWTASSEFGTYRLCEQRRFRRACASAQSRQNLRCSLIQAVSQEEPSDRKARSLAPLNDWACTVKICNDGMLEDTNSLDGAYIMKFRTSRKLKNTLIFLYILGRVGMKIFLIFLEGNKNCRVGTKKTGSVRLAETQVVKKEK